MRARIRTKVVCKQVHLKTEVVKKKWAAIKRSIGAFDPALSVRDEMEEARVGNLDHRFNHWTAVRDARESTHADVFLQIPATVKTMPDPIDQMKLFELIQIIPTPTRAALKSGTFTNYKNIRREDHGITCETIASSLLDEPIEQRPLRPSAKFLMRCGFSIANLNERFPNSTRSGFGDKGRSQPIQLSALSGIIVLVWLVAKGRHGRGRICGPS